MNMKFDVAFHLIEAYIINKFADFTLFWCSSDFGQPLTSVSILTLFIFKIFVISKIINLIG